MSHTINPHQPSNHNSHPATRGVNNSMPPPNRPASRIPSSQTGPRIAPGNSQLPFIPPHLQLPNPVTPEHVPAPSISFSGQSFQGNSGESYSNYDGSQNNHNNDFEPLSNQFNRASDSSQDFSNNGDHQHASDFNSNLPPVDSLSNQIDHDALQEIFGLTDSKLALAKKILQMSHPNVMGALVFGFLSLKPEVAGFVTPTPPSTTPIAVTSIDIRTFHYSNYIRDNIRDFIRSKILDAHIMVYSRQDDDNGVPQTSALLNLTQAHVDALPQDIQQQHLPPGYQMGDGAATRSVLQVIRDLLKHNRVTLRNLLLRNITNTSLCKVHGAAPSLEGLYNHINSAFSVNAGARVTPVDWAHISIRVKVRFAYLRLETAEHLLRPTPGHGAQWTPIDNQLLFLSQQSLGYLKAWASLIMEKDSELFGPRGTVYASVEHLPHLPTHEEVCERERLNMPSHPNQINHPASNVPAPNENQSSSAFDAMEE